MEKRQGSHHGVGFSVLKRVPFSFLRFNLFRALSPPSHPYFLHIAKSITLHSTPFQTRHCTIHHGLLFILFIGDYNISALKLYWNRPVQMDFSVPIKRYDTEGMFSSPPGPPSPTVPSRGSANGLSKLDLIFARPGVLKHNAAAASSASSSADSGSSSTRSTQGQSINQSTNQAHGSSPSHAINQSSSHSHGASSAGRASSSHDPSSSQSFPSSSQRSNIIVNTNRERAFSAQQREDSHSPRLLNGAPIPPSANGSGTGVVRRGNGIGGQNGVRFPSSSGQQRAAASPSLRSPPAYHDTLRYLQGSLRGSNSPVGQRMSLKPPHHHPTAQQQQQQTRPLKFAPMKPPPPLPQRSEPLRQVRDYVIHSNTSTPSTSTGGNTGNGRNSGGAGHTLTHDPDTLAKISELAKITRASIPMSPLEDDAEMVSTFRGRDYRELMPPPAARGAAASISSAAARTPSPSTGRSTTHHGSGGGGSKEVMTPEAMTSVASQLGIQVEVVHKLSPTPTIAMTLRSRFLAPQETNLGFSNFASAVAFLTLDEPPLNPLEIESSKDVLISIFGPKMTLYRCGGCESTFVFRSVFSDHLYRGIVPYRLRCSHCKDTLAFTNVCQVKEHVRSHGYTNFQLAKGFVLTVAEVNDENLQPGESLGAKLAAEQLAKSQNHSLAMKAMSAASTLPSSGVVSAVVTKPAAAPNSANRMLQEMLKRTDDSPPDVPRMASPLARPPEVTTYRQSQQQQQLMTSVPARNSAAHALQRLRLQVEAQAMMKNSQDFAKPSSPIPRQQQSLQQQQQQHQRATGQPLLRQIIRNPSTPQQTATTGATTSFDVSRGAPKIACLYCRSSFDGQSGITHHFQRFKDITDAAANYRCKECKVVCCNQCSFDAHQKIHRLNRSSPNMSEICCPECGLKLDNIEDITNHIERRCVHWCRMLCTSFNCCIQNCRYSSSNEDDYFLHMVNEHSGTPDGKNVCPVCRAGIHGPRSVLMEHLMSPGSCRQRILQQKSMFFAYHCVYCEESSGPVFETKAAMRDHIAHTHAMGLPKCAWIGLSQPPSAPPVVTAHAKRISTFSDFENTFKRPNPGSGGIVNSLLARRSAETSGAAPSFLTSDSIASQAAKQLARMDYGRLPQQQSSPTATHSPIIQNLSLLKRTLVEEDSPTPAPPPSLSAHKKSRLTFGCQLCTYEGSTHDELAAHTDQVHQYTREPKKLLEPGAAASVKKPSGRFECKVCEMERRFFSCDTASVFHDHVRRSHPAKDSSFQCSECALQLLSMSVLQMHLRVNHDVSDPTAFFAASPFYAGMRMIRQQSSLPTAAAVSPSFVQMSSTSAAFHPQQRSRLGSNSGIFQHSSYNPNDQAGGGGTSHN
ncbi:hypothetical protein BV898_14320 [Hypsibius exemplaris]|uniref:C2H2-type domain-containing protein n=1 Tax=Hypsibius exemplaris TaxID=2072580 RepID=A0A9X6NA99_HYPEX|nr:hypothetical protein BV898_14320 [Hypsibius exemplaris]